MSASALSLLGGIKRIRKDLATTTGTMGNLPIRKCCYALATTSNGFDTAGATLALLILPSDSSS